MNSNKIVKSQPIADRRYRGRIRSQTPLTKSDLARRWDVSPGYVCRLQADGAVQFVKGATRWFCTWEESESFMPGGAEAWMSVDETSSRTGHTKRQLELMRLRSVGPEWKKFGQKLLRYRRASVAAYNQAATTTKKID